MAEYTEDCCFNDIRDLCPIRRGPCSCACHADLPPSSGGYTEGFRAGTSAADVAVKALIAENARLRAELERRQSA